MTKVTATATLLLGNDDVTVNVFNDDVSYTHYFSSTNPDDWVLALDHGDYIVNMAGTAAPGGSVTLDMAGIASSTPAMPRKFTAAGKFISTSNITV